MKKILMFLLLLVGFVACTDRTAKYTESLTQVTDAVAAAQTISTEITQIESLITQLNTAEVTELTPENMTEIYSSLVTINQQLDNEIVQSVVSEYLSQNNIELNVDVTTLQAQLNAVPEYTSYVPAEGQPTQAEVTALLTSILGKIPGL